MKVRVIKRFYDLKEKRFRKAGDEFITNKARAEELVEKLPEGSVELIQPKKAKKD